MKKHRPNYRRVKIHRNYTVEEIAKLFDIHKNTVRHWIREGLETINDKRPVLILGPVLMVFLQARRLKNKRPCNPGELYCLRCHTPRLPAGNMADYTPVTEKFGNLVAICPDCNTIMNRRVSLARIGEFEGKVEINFTEASRRLMASAAGQAAMSQLNGIGDFLQPENNGPQRFPYRPNVDPGMEVGPVKSGVAVGQPYGPQAGRLVQPKALPAGQGFEMHGSLYDPNVIDADFTSKSRPAPYLTEPRREPTLALPNGQGFEMANSAASAEMPSFRESIGRYKGGDVIGRISPENAAEIQKLGFDTHESNVIIPQDAIKHIWESHGKQLTAGDVDYLEKTINEPTEILPNLSTDKSPDRDGSLLMVRDDGKKYISIVEITKQDQDNIVRNFWKMGKGAERYLDKFRQEKAQILQPGGRPLPHIPHNTPADAVGKPEGLSGSQVDDSGLFENNIASDTANVNKKPLANPVENVKLPNTGDDQYGWLKEKFQSLAKSLGEESAGNGQGRIPLLSETQRDIVNGINNALREKGYNISNSKALLNELNNYFSSSDLPIKQQAQIKRIIIDGIRQNSQKGTLVNPE